MVRKSGVLHGNLMAEFHIFGASLAAVNTIRILLDLGHKVYWQKMGERVLGHFGGMKLGEDLIDIGMVFLEYGASDAANPETSRFPETHKALNSFFPAMEVKTAVVKSLYEGSLVDDIIIADNLELIKDQQFTPSSLQHHPSEKWSNDYFEQQSYATVCSVMFPEFYDKYLRCFAEKITSLQLEDLSARYHRAAWLPLYYPETITSTKRNLLSYPFHRPKQKSIAAHMHHIIQHIESNPNCIVPDVPDDLSMQQRLSALKDVPRENIILCCRPEKMLATWKQEFDAHMIYQRLNIGFFGARKSNGVDIDCINDLDHPSIFRVFIQDRNSMPDNSIISVEFSGEWENADQANAIIQQYLTSLDIFEGIEPLKMMHGITGPGFPRIGAENQLIKLTKQIHERYHGCIIHGLPNGFTQTSMNAQILAATGIGNNND